MIDMVLSLVSADTLFSVSVTLLLAAIGAAFTMKSQIARTEAKQAAFEIHCEARFDDLSGQIGRLADYIHSMAGKL